MLKSVSSLDNNFGSYFEQQRFFFFGLKVLPIVDQDRVPYSVKHGNVIS